jgi:integrase
VCFYVFPVDLEQGFGVHLPTVGNPSQQEHPMKKGKTKNTRGAGRIYKRNAGKDFPADCPKRFPYWIQYTIPAQKKGKGKTVRHALKHEDGTPIYDRKEAEAERMRIVAPYLAAKRGHVLRVIEGEIRNADAETKQAEEAARNALPLAKVWDAYLAATNRPRSGPETLKQYESHWRRFHKWMDETHPDLKYFDDVSEKIASAYVKDLEGAGFSPNRFNKHLGFLKRSFRVLGEGRNPFKDVKPMEAAGHSRRELTIPELTKILEQAEGDLAALLHIGTWTGFRLGDCATLQWGEVDLVRGVIRRIPNKIKRKGKKAEVVVGIPSVLRSVLESLSGSRSGYVLPEFAADYERDATCITNRIQRHFLQCGIDVHAPGTGKRIQRDDSGNPIMDAAGRVHTVDTGKPAVLDVGFHSLRHTWVSMHAAAGTSGSLVQKSVGHASPAMTQHYTHVNDETAVKISKSLPALSSIETEYREPLPSWARELVDGMTGRNWKAVREKLLLGGE